jgi:excisionase family DNA binding protein
MVKIMSITVKIENGKVVGYLTSEEFAKKCGVTKEAVRMWIHRGQIEALTIGRDNWIKQSTPRPTKMKKV